MPEIGVLGRRQIQRMAAGVWRHRLVEPILAAHPSLLLAGAPSGYGKTVLAAQVATSGAFDSILWIDAMGEKGSQRETLLRLLKALSQEPVDDDYADVEGLAEACASCLAAAPDDSRWAVILDDVGWELDSAAVSLLEGISGEAPLGSLVVVTSRSESASASSSRSRWDVRAREFLLDSVELAELWESVSGGTDGGSQVERLASLSGGHAALALLHARRMVLSRQEDGSARFDADVAAVVRSLLRQLNDTERLVLHAACAMGDGSATALGRCCGLATADMLHRVAHVLPLVTLVDEPRETTFSVHSLLSDSLESPAELIASGHDCVARIVDELAESGRCIRAVDIAARSGDSALLSRSLGLVVNPMVIAEHQEFLRQSVDRLSAVELAGNPKTLLLHAHLLWESGRADEAIQAAQMAARLAEHGGDAETLVRARVSGLRMRASAGEVQGLASDVREMLGLGLRESDPETTMLVATSGVLAFSLLGDCAGLDECAALGRSLVRARHVTSITRSRFNVVLGVSSAVLRGAWEEAAPCFLEALGSAENLKTGAPLTMHDYSVALLESGALEESSSAATEALRGMGEDWPDGLRCLPRSMIEAVGLCRGEAVDPQPALETAFEYSVETGDWLSATLAAELSVRLLLMVPDLRAARDLAERAVQAALHTGSPVLLWLSELAQAQVDLVDGRSERAQGIAQRVLGLAEPIGASGHVLRARLILAAVALQQLDLARAVEHISCVSDYIVGMSPSLSVASFVRAVPGLLGVLALVIGVDRLPDRLLAMLGGPVTDTALSLAAAVLTPEELASLGSRMRGADALEVVIEPEPEREVICRVRLFGGLEVTTPKGRVGDRDWTKRKARLLFAMLVARFGTDVPRGEIVEYLWPEMDEERSLNNFYVVWSAMKRALTPGAVRDTPSPFVEHTHGVCRVVREHVVSDLDEFRDLLADARRARDFGDAEKELVALRAAEALYRGDVLPGDVYDDWFASVRDRYRHDFEDAMLRLAHLYLDRNEPHEGLACLRKVTSPEMWREDLFQALLRLQIAAGQRSAAIETYMLCRARLTEDLGIDPSRETTALYEQILGMEEGVGRTADGYGTADDEAVVRKW